MSDKNSVINYYNKTLADYQFVYFRNNDHSMHYGYWDEKVKNYHQALVRINGVIAEKLNLTKTDLVLDAGCGLGETSFWLADNIGCSVEGISITKSQIVKARKLAKEKAKGARLNFRTLDFTKTDYPDNHFDAVIAIEAICHLEDKSDFYREMSRILKPNGRLAVAEYTLKKLKLTVVQQKRMQNWLDGWAIPNLWTEKEHLQALEKAGFTSISSEDYSAKVTNAAKYLYFSALLGIPGYKILSWLHLLDSARLKNAQACKYQWLTKKDNLWGHNLYLAKKP